MRAIDRIVAVLDSIGSAEGDANIARVAAVCGLPLPTAARIVHDLSAVGAVTRDAHSGLLALGPRVQGWAAQTRVLSGPVGHLVVMQRVRDAIHETVSLQVLAGQSRVCIACVEGDLEVRRVVAVGSTQLATSGATGAALLAYMDPKDIAQVFTLCGLRHAEADRVRRILREVSLHGFASAADAVVENVAAVAVPVRTEKRGVLGVLAASGPAFRFTEEARIASVPLLKQSAGDIALAWR